MNGRSPKPNGDAMSSQCYLFMKRTNCWLIKGLLLFALLGCWIQAPALATSPGVQSSSVLGQMDDARRKWPEIFSPGFHSINVNGQDYYVACGYGERFFEGELNESTQDLWDETELDAKARIYSYFRDKKQAKIRVDISALSTLYYWVEQKKDYYRNYLIHPRDLSVTVLPPPSPPVPKLKTPVQTTTKANPSNNSTPEKVEPAAKVDPAEKIREIYKQATNAYYAGKYCGAFDKLNALKSLTALGQEDKFLYKECRYLCLIDSGKDTDNRAQLELANLYFKYRKFGNAYIRYRNFVTAIFEKDRWLKNVPAETLFRYAVSAVELKMPNRAKHLFSAIRQFYPTGDYWPKAQKYLEKIN